MKQPRAPFGAVPGAARRQVAADRLPWTSPARRSRVIRAIQPVGAEEQLVRVVLVHPERDVELDRSPRLMPARDRVVAEEEPPPSVYRYGRDAEVRAVDEAFGPAAPGCRCSGVRSGRPAPGRRHRWECRTTMPFAVDLRSVPLSCVPPQKRAGTVRYGGDRGELGDLQPRSVGARRRSAGRPCRSGSAS